MSILLSALISMASSTTGGEPANDALSVTPVGALPSVAGPADYFTGKVRIDGGFQRPAPAKVGGATVTFEPGARTAWHTHPLGQTLIVTAGVGWVQQWGQPRQQIRPGDTVWIAPGVKHWHGASADVAMTHIAIAEAVDGSPVTWMEKVSDAQYDSE
jgi:quercetin dioxygenase-like cupin family protein